MTIKPICKKCKKEPNRFGAILLSPPDGEEKVLKHHICYDCYNLLVKELK